MLKRLGYEVNCFTSSLDALKFFSENSGRIDLVITDQTMPLMAGDDLAKELIRIRPDIPVLLCTGYSEMITEEKAKAIGVQGIVMKPFTMKEGAYLVRHILDRRGRRKPT